MSLMYQVGFGLLLIQLLTSTAGRAKGDPKEKTISHANEKPPPIPELLLISKNVSQSSLPHHHQGRDHQATNSGGGEAESSGPPGRSGPLVPPSLPLSPSSQMELSEDAFKSILDSQNLVFLSQNNTLLTAHVGSTVTLACKVQKDSQFGMVSWARQLAHDNSYQILTIAEATHIDDNRFLIETNTYNYDWSLKILRVGVDDAGLYKCQANSHPPQFITVRLQIVEAFAEISGTEERFVKTGSKLTLNCSFHRLTEKPAFVFWFHNDRMINHDQSRGQSLQIFSTFSTLTLPKVGSWDSGNYTCNPASLRSASVLVHVLDEDSNSAAAIHTEDGTSDAHVALHAQCQAKLIPAMMTLILIWTQRLF